MKKILIICSCFLVLASCDKLNSAKNEIKNASDTAKDVLSNGEYYVKITKYLTNALAEASAVIGNPDVDTLKEKDVNEKIDMAVLEIQKIIDTKAPENFSKKKDLDKALNEMITVLKKAKEDSKKAFESKKPLSEIFNKKDALDKLNKEVTKIVEDLAK